VSSLVFVFCVIGDGPTKSCGLFLGVSKQESTLLPRGRQKLREFLVCVEHLESNHCHNTNIGSWSSLALYNYI